MEAKLERPSHGHEDGGTHSVVVGEGEGERHHQEKKSVLKKVKDKAKKIKDTIKKHGHGHTHHDQQNDDDDDDPDKYPEVHGTGAPMYESTVVRETNTNLEKPNHLHQHVTDQGDSEPENKNPPAQLVEEDPHSPNNTPATATANIPPSTPTGGTLNVHDAPISQQTTNPEFNTQNQDCSDDQDSSKKPLKEYLSEKFKPGDEDKALSEAITDALHKGDREKEREDPVPVPRRGKVTVSQEVAERLGTDRESKREGEDAVVAGEESSGVTVAERLQNAVTSWLSKSTGIQTAQDSLANAFVNNAGSASSSGGGGDGPTSVEPRHR